LNHAVRSYQYSKQEIERILNTSTKKLKRRELSVRAKVQSFVIALSSVVDITH